jgi:hypothetical protein
MLLFYLDRFRYEETTNQIFIERQRILDPIATASPMWFTGKIGCILYTDIRYKCYRPIAMPPEFQINQ